MYKFLSYLKQTPFFLFVALKIIAACQRIFAGIVNMGESMIHSYTIGRFNWDVFMPDVPLVPWTGYFILSALYGFRLKKKHLLLATIFVSWEWILMGLIWGSVYSFE